MKRIEIGIGSGREATAQFARTWQGASRGERLPQATPCLDFTSLAELLGALTAKRLALLDTLAVQPGLSIRALAGRLGRDYKNVHRRLCSAGSAWTMSAWTIAGTGHCGYNMFLHSEGTA